MTTVPSTAVAGNARAVSPPIALYRTALSSTDAQSLLDRFRPVVYLDEHEQYFPCSVDWFLSKVSVGLELEKGIYSYLMVPYAAPSDWPEQIASMMFGEITSGVSADQLRDPRFKPATSPFRLPVRDPEGVYGGQRAELEHVPCYGIVIDHNEIGARDLVYGFFYAYNGLSMNDHINWDVHEGDWEHVVVRVDVHGALLGIFYQAHKSGDPYSGWYEPPSHGQKAPAGRRPFQLDPQTGRPLVFASRSGHGSYVAADSYPYGGVRGTDYCSAGTRWEPAVTLIDPYLQPWVRYTGRMGGDLFTINGEPPVGPLLQGWFIPRPDGPLVETTLVIDMAYGIVKEKLQTDKLTPLAWHTVTQLAPGASLSVSLMDATTRAVSTLRDGTVTPGTLDARVVQLTYQAPAPSAAVTGAAVFGAIGVKEIEIVATAAPYQSSTQPVNVPLTPLELACVRDLRAVMAAGDDPDVYLVIADRSTGTLSVAHLDASRGYTRTDYSVPLPAGQLGDFDAFLLGGPQDMGAQPPDLFLIKRHNVDSGHIEVHAALGAQHWTQISVHAKTPLTPSDPYTLWAVGNIIDGEAPDLLGISIADTADSTVHTVALSGQSTFTQTVFQGRPLPGVGTTSAPPTQAFIADFSLAGGELYLFGATPPELAIFGGEDLSRVIVGQMKVPILPWGRRAPVVAGAWSVANAGDDLLVIVGRDAQTTGLMRIYSGGA